MNNDAQANRTLNCGTSHTKFEWWLWEQCVATHTS